MNGVTPSIAAIREFRSRHGCSLAEARDAIAEGWTADTWANRFRSDNARDDELRRLEANARSRAAAPDMLEALEDAEAALMNAIYLHGEAQPWVFALGNVRAAIAKATGEENG